MRWLAVAAGALVMALVAVGWWAFEASAWAEEDGHLVISFVTGIAVALAIAGGVGAWRRPSDPEPRVSLLLAPIVPTVMFRLLPPPGLAASGALAWMATAGLVVWVLAGRPALGPLVPRVAGVVLAASALIVVLAAGPHGRSAPVALRPSTWATVEAVTQRAVQQVNPFAVRPSDKATVVAWAIWVVALAPLALVVAGRARPPVGLRRVGVAAFTGATLAASVPQRVGAPATEALLDRSASDLLLAVGLVPLAALAVVATWRELIVPRLSEAHDGALELDRASSPEALRRGLARTLDDPSAVVRFPRDDGWIDEAGRPVDPPAATSDRAWTVIRRAGAPVAALEHDPSVATHPDLVALAATNLALTVEAQRHAALAEADAIDARESASRTLEAVAAARRDVERRIVDGPLHRLDLVAARLDTPALDLDGVHDALIDALGEVRAIAHGPVPVAATGEGLTVALHRLQEVVATPFDLDGTGDDAVSTVVETTVLLTVADAAQRASGRLRVGCASTGDAIEVRVAGDHGGLGEEATSRIESLGGRVRSTTEALSITIPIAEEGR